VFKSTLYIEPIIDLYPIYSVGLSKMVIIKKFLKPLVINYNLV